MAAVAEPFLTVYYSQGGRKYHENPNCPVLESAQALWDADGPDDHPLGAPWFGGYAIRRAHERYAYAAQGKRPCLVCLPGRGVPFRSEADFGHRPVVGFIDGRAIGQICVRCQIVHRRVTVRLDGDLYTLGGVSTVKWPCASAIVLGLADGEQAVQPFAGARAA
jgi:hypothetical protein